MVSLLDIKRTYSFLFSKKGLALALSLVLLVATVVHMIEFDHHHPEGFFGHSEEQVVGVEVLYHGQDKKFWAILLLMYAVSAYVFIETFRLLRIEKFLIIKKVDPPKLIQELFSSGVVQRLVYH